MTGLEMRAARKNAAMTQHELAEKLNVSRKTVIGWEQAAGQLDEGVSLRVLRAVGGVRVIENTYRVDVARDGAYAVVGQRMRDVPTDHAMVWLHSEFKLFGVFKRRDHAYRWRAALAATADPRDTRKLAREKVAD